MGQLKEAKIKEEKIKEYTTTDKIAADILLKSEEQTGEAKKIELSNDAFAICDFINSLINKIEHARLNRK